MKRKKPKRTIMEQVKIDRRVGVGNALHQISRHLRNIERLSGSDPKLASEAKREILEMAKKL